MSISLLLRAILLNEGQHISFELLERELAVFVGVDLLHQVEPVLLAELDPVVAQSPSEVGALEYGRELVRSDDTVALLVEGLERSSQILLGQ